MPDTIFFIGHEVFGMPQHTSHLFHLISTQAVPKKFWRTSVMSPLDVTAWEDSLRLRALSPVPNRILTFTSGATPADLLEKLYIQCHSTNFLINKSPHKQCVKALAASQLLEMSKILVYRLIQNIAQPPPPKSPNWNWKLLWTSDMSPLVIPLMNWCVTRGLPSRLSFYDL